MSTELQISFFDKSSLRSGIAETSEPATPKAKRARKEPQPAVKVELALAKMRQLRDELNQLLAYDPGERPTINSPADAVALVANELEILDHEELHVMLLDRRNHVLQIVRLYVGSVNSSQVRIGEVFKPAIIHTASSIIVMHNHPSGDPTPSPDDVAVTRAMYQAGKLLDIEVLDHLVIGHKRWVSLKERGLGFSL